MEGSDLKSVESKTRERLIDFPNYEIVMLLPE